MQEASRVANGHQGGLWDAFGSSNGTKGDCGEGEEENEEARERLAGWKKKARVGVPRKVSKAEAKQVLLDVIGRFSFQFQDICDISK